MAFHSSHDVRYVIVMLALMKLGKTPVLCPWPDSILAHGDLRQAANSRFLFHDRYLIQSNYDPLAGTMWHVRVPDALETLPRWQAESIPERPPVGHADIVLFLLTTLTIDANPRFVYIPSSAFHALQNIPDIAAPPGRQTNVRQLCSTPLLLSCIPFFSMSGIEVLCRTLYHRRPIVLLNRASRLSAKSVRGALDMSAATSLVAPPFILCEIWRAGDVDLLARLECVFSDGVLVNRDCGDAIAARTRLHNGIGSVAMGRLPSLVPLDPKDWYFFEPIPGSGVDMEACPGATTDSTLARLVIRPHPSPEVTRASQLVFHISPSPQCRTSNLFTPGRPGLWHYIGTTQDMIVLSQVEHGGKYFDPTLLERAVAGCEHVKDASVFGTGRSHAGLLIEMAKPELAEVMAHATTERALILQHVWSRVEEVNRLLPFHAEVWKSMILFVKPGQSIRRDAQGAVARRETEVAFQHDISELYRMVDQGPEATEYKCSSAAEMERDVRERVATVVGSVFGLEADDIAADENFFLLPGADSMRIVHISHRASAEFGTRISVQQVYQHSTIQSLARSITDAFCNRGRGCSVPILAARNGPGPHPALNTISREQCMSAMIHERLQSLISSLNQDKGTGLPPQSGEPHQEVTGKFAVLLVGSTGVFGSHLLHELLREKRTDTIWCLNESFSAAQEQRESFRQLRLNTRDQLDGDRVKFVPSHNLGNDRWRLGIATDSYTELAEGVDVIIHNAWPTNLTLPLPFFTDSIKGVAALAELAVRAGSTMALVSSVASCMNYAAIRRHPPGSELPVEVPETFCADHSMPAKHGFGESMHVAESILDAVAKRYAVQTLILRLGHLGGTTWGQYGWDKKGKLGSHLGEETAANANRLDCLSHRHIAKDGRDSSYPTGPLRRCELGAGQLCSGNDCKDVGKGADEAEDGRAGKLPLCPSHPQPQACSVVDHCHGRATDCQRRKDSAGQVSILAGRPPDPHPKRCRHHHGHASGRQALGVVRGHGGSQKRRWAGAFIFNPQRRENGSHAVENPRGREIVTDSDVDKGIDSVAQA